jgi:membrane fusion protein (multidrug efflux system)
VDPIRASFAISEREYLRYAELLNQINNPQSQARGYLELLLIDGRVHPYRAGKVIVNRQVDPSTGTLTLQALFPNPGNILRPGLFSKVRSHEGQEADAVLVPERAVQELQGSYRVSVVGPDQRVQVRPVQLGPLLGHSYVVESGLRAGERVIVEGLENVQPGAKVNVQLLPAPQASAAADPGTAATTDPPEPVAGPAGPESRRQGRTAPGARKAR